MNGDQGIFVPALLGIVEGLTEFLPVSSTAHLLLLGHFLDFNSPGRLFEVLTGGGHSPEQVMLYCPAERLFLGADQVLATISPNVSVWAVDGVLDGAAYSDVVRLVVGVAIGVAVYAGLILILAPSKVRLVFTLVPARFRT